MKRRHDYAQHFLRRPDHVKELVGHANIKKTDTVLDIGAGSGIITSVLSVRAKHVIAIENQPATVTKLRENTADCTNVTIIDADFLSMQLPPEPYKVFANIPFNLSADIVRKLTLADTPPSDIFLIVQKQFAKKLLIDSDQFTGMLGAQLSPWWNVSIRKPLKRTDFWPHPNVDTVLVHLAQQPAPALALNEQKRFMTFVEQCFHSQVYFGKLHLFELLATNKQRPSQLSSVQWIQLYKKVQPLAKSR